MRPDPFSHILASNRTVEELCMHTREEKVERVVEDKSFKQGRNREEEDDEMYQSGRMITGQAAS